MSLATTAEKNNLCTRYAADVAYASLHTASPGSNGASELSGGSPAYARVQISWGTASNGSITGTATLNVPNGTQFGWWGGWTAATGGTYLDGAALSASVTPSAQSTYALTLTFSAA